MSMMEKQLIPVGYKQTEVGVIPNDWGIEPLCDVLDKNRHIRYGVVQPGKYTPDGCLMLRSQDYSKGWSDADGMHRLNKTLEKQFQNAKLKSGDLVITIVGAGVAQVVEIPDWIDGTILSRSTARIAVNEEVASSKFILYVMSSSLGRTQVLFNIKEGAQPVVSSRDVGSCLIPLPGRQEQTAIANALSDVDALIAALEKLINKKSAIKTAAMQQLLTGKKRLPPFDQLNTGFKQTELGEIPGDWEVASVHQLLNESPKYGINAAAVPLTANLPVYIRITDISEDGYFQPSERVGVNNQFSGFYKLQKGDIVIARTGASVVYWSSKTGHFLLRRFKVNWRHTTVSRV